MIKEILFKYVGMGYIAIVDGEKFETNGIYLKREKLLEKILKEYGIDLYEERSDGVKTAL